MGLVVLAKTGSEDVLRPAGTVPPAVSARGWLGHAGILRYGFYRWVRRLAHEVTNVGTDRHQLAKMAEKARTAMGAEEIEAVADGGYYEGEEIRACEMGGITVTLPKPRGS